jgi:hypothetical protein
LSIGTGIPPNVEIGDAVLWEGKSFVKGLVAVASNSERAHHAVRPLAMALREVAEEKYYRFNVGWKIPEEKGVRVEKKFFRTTETPYFNPENWKAGVIIEMDDYDKMDEFLITTRNYINEKDQQDLIAKCAARLRASK